jgi:hypothetical protein
MTNLTTAVERRDAQLQEAPETVGSSPWDATWRLAQRIASTPFVPKALLGRKEAVLACILYGQELGLGPMQSLASINVIDARPAASPELMRALVARAGHRIDVVEMSATKVTIQGKRADTGSEARVTWTMDDAKRAGLAGRGAWATYPRAMLLARATSELCRAIFPDVIAGLSYTPEEVAGIAGHDYSEPPPGVDADTGEIVEAEVLDAEPEPESAQLPIEA